jgi:signal transduction histidine kinase
MMGWFLAAMISKPIENLIYFSRELGRGNFRVSVPQSIHGELAILSKSMDKMRSDLRSHHQEKEEMLAQIAHELRNPLGGIELLAGLVKEDLHKTGQNVAYIEKITREIHTLKNLINNYLNFSRPVQAHPQKINLIEIVDNMKEILMDRLLKKNIKIKNKFEEIYIQFDPNHIRHILTNLVTNSIDASAPDSDIEIIQKRDSGQFLVMVKDQGSGINTKNIDKIFNPFYSTRENGAGLGLAICKKLCQENKAEIWAENNSTQGCTFFIKGNLSA